MDDMDDVIQEIKQRGQVTKTEFAQIVREVRIMPFLAVGLKLSVQGSCLATSDLPLCIRDDLDACPSLQALISLQSIQERPMPRTCTKYIPY